MSNNKFSAVADSWTAFDDKSWKIPRDDFAATTAIDVNRLKMYECEFQSNGLFVTAIRRPWFIFTFYAFGNFLRISFSVSSMETRRED